MSELTPRNRKLFMLALRPKDDGQLHYALPKSMILMSYKLMQFLDSHVCAQ